MFLRRMSLMLFVLTIILLISACGNSENKVDESKDSEGDQRVSQDGNTTKKEKEEQKEDKSDEEISDQIDESLKSRESNKTIEYTAVAESKDGFNAASDSDEALVYKLKIKDDKLIVWGSLDSIENDSKKEYLRDEKRVFELADDVDLGLDWVGDFEEQIQYFNKNGSDLNGEVFYFKISKGKVTHLTFAG